MADDNPRFRWSWKHCVLFGLTWTLVMIVLITGTRLIAGSQTPRLLSKAVVLLLLGYLVFLTVVAAAISLYYGLEAKRTNLRVRSSSGRYVEVPWHAIEDVKSISLGGLPLLRVRYAGAVRPAFIPLWLADPSGFRAAATAYAGDSNVLVRWLVQHPRANRFRLV